MPAIFFQSLKCIQKDIMKKLFKIQSCSETTSYDYCYIPVYSGLFRSELVWTGLNWSGPVWSSLNCSGPVWTSLNWSNPVFSVLTRSEPVSLPLSNHWLYISSIYSKKINEILAAKLHFQQFLIEQSDELWMEQLFLNGFNPSPTNGFLKT